MAQLSINEAETKN